MKRLLVITLAIILALCLNVVVLPAQAAMAQTTIYVDDDFEDDPVNHKWDTIQEGVDDADPGDTVYVHNGTYIENVSINKEITLIGENRDNVIVDGYGIGDCISIYTADISISNLTLQDVDDYGIDVYGPFDLSLNNVSITGCGDYAIRGGESSAPGAITLTECTIENNGGGVDWGSFSYEATGNATIEGNSIKNNSGYGLTIYLAEGQNATINNNQLDGNTACGIKIRIGGSGGDVTLQSNSVINSGTVGIYIHSANNVVLTDTLIDTTSLSNGLSLYDCPNVTINSPFTITNADEYGIYVYGPSDLSLNNGSIIGCGDYAIRGGESSAPGAITLTECTIENNGGGVDWGSFSYEATGNATIEGNSIKNNSGYGLTIYLAEGQNATINNNQLDGNTACGIKIRIGGSGGDVTLQSNSVINSGTVGIYIHSANNVVLTDTLIDTTSLSNGLSLYDCPNVTINSPFTITNADEYGIYVYGPSDLSLNNGSIIGCGDYAIRGGESSAPGAITLTECTIENNGGGVDWGSFSYEATGNATIEGNSIKNNSGYGLTIYLAEGQNATINNNQLDGNTACGIKIRIGGSGGDVTLQSNSVINSGTVGIYIHSANNVVLTDTLIDTTSLSNGLSLYDCPNVTINSPFTITNADEYGIYVYGPSDLSLNNGSIIGCGDYAIRGGESSAPGAITLTECTIENNGGGVDWGSFFYAATGNATIEGNSINNNSQCGIRIDLAEGQNATINNNQLDGNGTFEVGDIFIDFGIDIDIFGSGGDVTLESNSIINSKDNGIGLRGIGVNYTMVSNTVINSGRNGISIYDANNVVLTDTLIDTTSTSNGLSLYNCPNVTINSPFTITNANEYGIYVNNPFDLSLNNVSITGCGDYAIRGGESSVPGAITLTECTIENNGGGVYWGTGGTEYYAIGDATIDDNTISNNSGYGLTIYLAEGQNATINNNQLDGNTACGIDIHILGSGGDVTLESNSVKNSAEDGIALVSAGNMTMVSNSVINSGDNGIYLNSYSTATITLVNNNITYNSQYGIYLNGDVTAIFGNSVAEWNNIYTNGIGDLYNGNLDITAAYVYWGTTNEAEIEDRIYHNPDNNNLGTVTFTPWLTFEHPDTTDPYTSGHNPAKDATGVAIDTSIVVHVQDDGDGVDQATIVMTVEGVAVTPVITGAAADYTLTYDPPADFGYLQVVDVTIDADDLAGNAMTTDSYSFAAEATVDISLKAGWNMVSVPVTPADNSTSAVFPGVAGVFTWNATSRSYYEPTVIDPEKGYWVAVTENTTIAINGTPIETWTTDIKAGWNMIGSVNTSASIADPNDDPDGSVIPPAYWWDPVSKSYVLTTDIEPGKGYWVASVNDCVLTL